MASVGQQPDPIYVPRCRRCQSPNLILNRKPRPADQDEVYCTVCTLVEPIGSVEWVRL
jgi:hypothetical protein